MSTETCEYRANRTLIWVFLASLLLTALLPAARAHAAPQAQTTSTVELISSQDARIQGGSPDNGFGNGFLWVGTTNGHLALVQFDLTVLPVDATVDNAELTLNFTGAYTGTANVEVGGVNDPWDEATITWNNRPAITFGGPVQPVEDAPGDISWDVTSLVARWQSGTVDNNGLALRGDGRLKSFHSRETNSNLAPRLTITYTIPPEEPQPHPDLGDAPDSTNHHGQPNTAYPGAGVLGQFPTVYEVPANQVAGPRHDNQTGEGILGQFLSREREADLGNDQDGPNNIIRNPATGAIGDVADMDRGDDGWRNRNIKFFDCRKQTLTVRVSKAPSATRNRMYLNVWFDGNRDGDWQDIAPCADPNGGPAQASYEWIVQDYVVDMTAVPAGGFLDFNVDTERVLNSTGGLPHWMRFTLSEERAEQPANGDYPDGRGPHPQSAQKSFRFGETEDVLQRPPLAGEEGELIVEKRVITDGEPVEYAGDVTYQIRLRHEGGSQPIEAQIRDELPYPLHLLRQIDDDGDIFLVNVTSPTGGAAPLEAELQYDSSDPTVPVNQVVFWEGTLEPNAEVVLSFDVHIHPICASEQQTEPITNVAQARPRAGDPITGEVTFSAQCPGYRAPSIEIDPEPELNPNGIEDWTQVQWQGNVRNLHTEPVTLAFFQQPSGSRASVGAARASNEPNKNGRVDGDPDLRFLKRVTLAPNQERLLDLILHMEQDVSDEFMLPDDYSPTGRVLFCILPGEDDYCADAAQYPHLWGEVPQPNVVPGPDDLGDAPDSTNHFGAAMAAYPGVPANFPTVFDPAAGLPQGPKHRHPGQLHLGPNVSREAEADIGPDADGINNITPPANTANQDWFDDGSRLSIVANCRPARADVLVKITPQMANLFAQLEKKAYLNVWLDMNHDGDWADGATCVDEAGQNKEVVEHILIDYPIDVAGLGAGLHPIQNIATREVLWPAALAQESRWVRFTLSERESNKTLTFGGIQYGDGRGYARHFKVGETEDHLRYFNSPNQQGPDMAVRLKGQIVRQLGQDGVLLSDVTAQSLAMQDGEYLRFKVDYANRGSALAAEATMTFGKSDALRGLGLALLRGPGLDAGDYTDGDDTLLVRLPDLEPDESSSIVLIFGPLPNRQVAAAATGKAYTAAVRIDVAGEVDDSDNTATTTVQRPKDALILAATVESDDLWRKADTTCRDRVTLSGRGEAMQQINLYVNDEGNIQLQFDAEGQIDDALLTNLAEGRNLIRAGYTDSIGAVALDVVSPRDAASGRTVKLIVNTDLPVDPITLLFTNSQGRQYHPPTIGWSRRTPDPDTWRLRDGERYTMSIAGCVSDPNLSIRVEVDDEVLAILHDEDGDGLYTGSFTYASGQDLAAASVSTSEVRVVVESGGVEQSFTAAIESQPQAVVSDAASGQPLGGAQVVALTADDTTSYAIAPAGLMGDANPQTTDADGRYGFRAADGLYRLDVTRTGYQPYRSDDILVEDGRLATEIKLTPTVDEPADHTVYILAGGFTPATLTVSPGDVIEWVNADLADHQAMSDSNWDSGILTAGAGYKVRLDAEGSYTYSDRTGDTATIVVDKDLSDPDDPPAETHTVFLPLVLK